MYNYYHSTITNISFSNIQQKTPQYDAASMSYGPCSAPESQHLEVVEIITSGPGEPQNITADTPNTEHIPQESPEGKWAFHDHVSIIQPPTITSEETPHYKKRKTDHSMDELII